MRIVHFSDIHFSSENYDELRYHFLDALINDLNDQRKSGDIDLIVITGDLLDKGGDSLLTIDIEDQEFQSTSNPFEIFEQLFITPISKQLGISKDRFLFVPGNHDVDESVIRLKDEAEIIRKLGKDPRSISDILKANRKDFKYSERIQKFKSFEENYRKKYGGQFDNYRYSNNESTYIYTDDRGTKYGFILLNDSWRCKSVGLLLDLEFDKHERRLHIGENQIAEGYRTIQNEGAEVFICLMHHPLEKFVDGNQIEGILSSKRIDLLLFGDLHEFNFEKIISTSSSIVKLRGRNLLLNHNSIELPYMCGYALIDIEKGGISRIIYRLYDGRPGNKRFVPDVIGNEGGILEGENDNRYSFNHGESKVKIDVRKDDLMQD